MHTCSKMKESKQAQKQQITRETVGQKKKKKLEGKKYPTNTIRTTMTAIISISARKSGTLSKYSTHKMLLRDRWLSVQIGSRLHLPYQAFAKNQNRQSDRQSSTWRGQAPCKRRFYVDGVPPVKMIILYLQYGADVSSQQKIIYALYKYLTPKKDFDSATFEPLSYLFSGNIQALKLD